MADEVNRKMRTWEVSVPIAGTAFITVEALSEDDAINQALDEVCLDNIETWEALRQFNRGNVCYCPHPWEAEATDATPDED